MEYGNWLLNHWDLCFIIAWFRHDLFECDLARPDAGPMFAAEVLNNVYAV